MTEPLGWLAAYAAKHGLTYEPEADERWLRAFEPLATLRTPIRYEHALHATGERGSVSIARFIVSCEAAAPEGPRELESGAWIAFTQDVRLATARAAGTSDLRPPSPFGEPLDLVTMPRMRTGDPSFDGPFAAFSPTTEDLATAITPSLRKLLVSWGVPLHFEVRPGAFVLSPVSLPADPRALAWLFGAVQFFGEKAAKRVK